MTLNTTEADILSDLILAARDEAITDGDMPYAQELADLYLNITGHSIDNDHYRE